MSSIPTTPGLQDRVPRRSWWSRNWKWVVPVGIGAPIVIGGGFLALIFMLVFGLLTGSVPYTEAVAAAQADAGVTGALGRPLEGGLPMGNIEVNNRSGYADLAIPITGPRGEGTIYVVAEADMGEWYFTTLEVVTDRDEWFDLLE